MSTRFRLSALLVGLALVSAPTYGQEIVTREGLAEPFDADGQEYVAFGLRTPMLRSFYLGFDIADPSPSDHEVALVQVLAGGNAEDLSPNADLTPANVPDGRLNITIQDSSPSGEEFYYTVAHSLAGFPTARRYQIRDVGCVDHCVRSIADVVPRAIGPFRPVVALVGFKLFFVGAADHDLDRIGVWFEGDELHVALRDQNGGDVFGYLVDFIVIPSGRAVTGSEQGTAVGGQTIGMAATPQDAVWMLTGWEFDFISGDHEIRDIGVFRRAEDLTVFFADKDGDDRFDWRVDWAQIGNLISQPNPPRIDVLGGGVAR